LKDELGESEDLRGNLERSGSFGRLGLEKAGIRGTEEQKWVLFYPSHIIVPLDTQGIES